MLLTTRLSCQTSAGYVIENAINTRWDVRLKSRKLQVKSSHEVCDLVDVRVVLVPSQVVNANPSDLCKLRKLGKKYLNSRICKFYSFSEENLKTLDILRTFLPVTVAKSSTVENSPILAHLVCSASSI